MLAMLENFLLTQGKSMIMSGITALVVMLYAHFGLLSSFISQAQLMSWLSVAVAAGVVAIIHLFDHNYNPTASADPNAPAPAAPAVQPPTPPPAPSAK